MRIQVPPDEPRTLLYVCLPLARKSRNTQSQARIQEVCMSAKTATRLFQPKYRPCDVFRSKFHIEVNFKTEGK